MKMTMTKPCPHCPFRTDIFGYLTGPRAREITDSLTIHDQTFPCHETTVPSEDGYEMEVVGSSQHCAGALIFMEKQGKQNQWMQISGRLGWYDQSKLKLDAPIFDTAEEMEKHHEHG